jgi:hypothetical protein
MSDALKDCVSFVAGDKEESSDNESADGDAAKDKRIEELEG